MPYRTLRAGVQARATLLAGFTTLRDLGTEGAGYADVSLRRAIAEGLVAGPRLFVATRAIVATGSYGPAPKGSAPTCLHAAGRRGGERRGRDDPRACASRPAAAPTGSRCTPTTAGARTAAAADVLRGGIARAGRDRAYLGTAGRRPRRHRRGHAPRGAAGVDTIEHGYGGTPEEFKLMAEARRGVPADAHRGGATPSTSSTTCRDSRRRPRAWSRRGTRSGSR